MGDEKNIHNSGSETLKEHSLTEKDQGISRKQALKYIGYGAGGLLVGGGTGFYGYRKSLQISSSEADQIKKAKIVVAGGSIGGLTAAARLLRAVPDADITVIEPREQHHYQPGYTLVGAGVYNREDVIFDQKSLFLSGMKWIKDYVQAFEPDQNRILTRGGERVSYDYLIVGLGVETNLDSIENLREALQTDYVANIYDLKSSEKYRQLAKNFEGGNAVFTYPAGYVKCGGAPQKITWLSEDLWRNEGKRDRTNVHFYTTRPSLFPVVPKVDQAVTPLIEKRGILNHYNHVLRAIDISTRTAIFEETGENGTGREIRQPYDLLHPMPAFQTPEPLRNGPLTREGIGGQLSVDRQTLQHTQYSNIFGVGDNAATGAAKTAATIRKQAPVVAGNIIDQILGHEPSNNYDGASGCPLLTRYGRCMMFEFDYQGNLINEWIYRPTQETRLWWNFKVHGLKRLYRHVMMNGYV